MHQRYPLDPATGACTPLGVTDIQANKLTRCHCRLRIEGDSPENTLCSAPGIYRCSIIRLCHIPNAVGNTEHCGYPFLFSHTTGIQLGMRSTSVVATVVWTMGVDSLSVSLVSPRV